MSYGMPYKGSKSKIAAWIIDTLPDADVFVDLFGGGGAISHYAALSHKYNKVIYNEIEPLIYNGFDMAIHGKFKNEDRWISREDFFKLKDTDPYVAMCFSFGNDTKTYCYSVDLEPYKKALHELIFWRKIDNIIKYPFVNAENAKRLCEIEDRKQRRIGCRNTVLNNAAQIQSLESLERLQSLERLETFNRDYADVPLPPNSVVYCDIPYRGTNTYLNEFDYDRFYKWALECPQIVFISEYDMPEGFYQCDYIHHYSTLSCTNMTKVKERLFCNRPYKANKQLSFF